MILICWIDDSLLHPPADGNRKAIYFDGALPIDKRGTRLDRHEKSRLLLESYRRQHPGPFRPSLSSDPRICEPAETSVLQDGVSSYTWRTPALPQPPFMVACVLDDLRHHWFTEIDKNVQDSFVYRDFVHPLIEVPTFADLVLSVPGEADAYCASIAKLTGAAILSSDSDMTMYDLGSEGSLILLDSLELVRDDETSPGQQPQAHRLTAQKMHPTGIADRLKIKPSMEGPKLLRYGFERQTDPSASAGIIRSRCLAPSHSSATNEEFKMFCEKYKLAVDGIKENIKVMTSPQLDPRVSELYWQYNDHAYINPSAQHPHFYLPVLIEDSTRDSSWAYGQQLRRLAYSLLNLSDTHLGHRHSHVVEVQRRGSRIVSVPIELLNHTACLTAITKFRGNLVEPHPETDALLRWRLFGFREVAKQRHENGKPTVSVAFVATCLTSGYIDGTLSWDDVHVYANVQAVLYSLWILKQLSAASWNAPDLQCQVDGLNSKMASLSSLTHLMASRKEIPVAGRTVSRMSVAEYFGHIQIPGVERDSVESAPLRKRSSKVHKQSKAATAKTASTPSPATRARTKSNKFELLVLETK